MNVKRVIEFVYLFLMELFILFCYSMFVLVIFFGAL